MAITQVRALFNGQWHTLTWNSATSRYECSFVPETTSHHQPDGVYSITVEATNDSGAVSTVDGGTMASLRLTVNETTAPVLTIEAPAAGYVTENQPTVVWTATDETGGSGVDPDSLTLTLDGGAWAGTLTRETIENGYRFRFAPSAPLGEGLRIFRVSIRDYDRNLAAAERSFTVDTVPPALTQDRTRVVVDEKSLLLTGQSGDVTAPPVTVTIRNNGAVVGTADRNGDDYRFSLPLSIGENHITVTATDGAGLETDAAAYVIRLITDRAQADADALNALLARPMSQWTEEETAALLSGGMKGGYFAADLNRVGAAVDYLAEKFHSLGYAVTVSVKQDWSNSDDPTDDTMETYRQNVAALRAVAAVFADTPAAPADMVKLTWREANDIEKILVDVDALITRMERSWYYSGEACAGEV